MIVGLGIDLVAIQKIAKSAQSESFRHKVFSAAEIASCEQIKNSAEHYAGKFAAKEAFMKAIGKGIRQEVWFSQIEVLNHDTGEPYIQVNRRAESALRELGAQKIHVTISHHDGMAVAVVILEK